MKAMEIPWTTYDNMFLHFLPGQVLPSASPHLGSGGYLAGQRWRGPSESSGQAKTSSLICLHKLLRWFIDFISLPQTLQLGVKIS